MLERGRIKVGIDYDGVIINKAPGWHVTRRISKMGLQNSPNVVEGINSLRDEPDVDVLGIYTARPESFRKKQTHNQIRRLGIAIEKVTHTAGSSKAKIEALLLDATGFNKEHLEGDELTCPTDIKQIVLIDDSVSSVVTAAKRLAEEKPCLRQLMKNFTLVAFNPKQPEELKGIIIPGIIHVVSMRSWSDTTDMLEEIRDRS